MIPNASPARRAQTTDTSNLDRQSPGAGDAVWRAGRLRGICGTSSLSSSRSPGGNLRNCWRSLMLSALPATQMTHWNQSDHWCPDTMSSGISSLHWRSMLLALSLQRNRASARTSDIPEHWRAFPRCRSSHFSLHFRPSR